MAATPSFGEALLRIAPDQIFIPQRLGLYFPDKAAALGKLMAIHGQRTPITVRKSAAKVAQPWTLVTGMHRLNGAIIEGLPEVIALERVGLTGAEALDEEASENLDRREQPPLERAIFIHATCAAAQARLVAEHGTDNMQVLGGKARQNSASATMARARWDRVKAGEIRADQAMQDDCNDTCANLERVYGWADSVAEAFGRGKSDVYRALKLHRMLVEPFPDLMQALSDHPVVGGNQKQLLDLAAIDRADLRRAAIEMILGDKELSADEARVRVGIDQPKGPAPLPYQKHLDAIVGGWSRLKKDQQRRFVSDTLPGLLTEGMKRDLRDRLNAELGEVAPAGEVKVLTPAVPVRQSVKPDYIACLEDGTRHINLTMHLNRIGMTPSEYRARWSLPCDYPMLAPNYSYQRRKAWRERVRAARAAKAAGQ